MYMRNHLSSGCTLVEIQKHAHKHVHVRMRTHVHVHIAHGCAGTRCRQACTTHCAHLCAVKAPLVPAFQRNPLQRVPSNQFEIFAFSLQLPGGGGWRSRGKFLRMRTISRSRLLNASWRLNGKYCKYLRAPWYNGIESAENPIPILPALRLPSPPPPRLFGKLSPARVSKQQAGHQPKP